MARAKARDTDGTVPVSRPNGVRAIPVQFGRPAARCSPLITLDKLLDLSVPPRHLARSVREGANVAIG